MPNTTKYATATGSPLTGQNFDRTMDGTGASETVSPSVSANSTENDYYTISESELGEGVDVGTHTFILEVTSGDSNMDCNVRVQRYNSSDSLQQSSSLAGSQTLSSAQEYTFTMSSVDLGTWSAGDYLAINVQLTSTSMHSAAQVSIGHAVAASTQTRHTFPESEAAAVDKNGTDTVGVETNEGTTVILSTLSRTETTDVSVTETVTDLFSQSDRTEDVDVSVTETVTDLFVTLNTLTDTVDISVDDVAQTIAAVLDTTETVDVSVTDDGVVDFVGWNSTETIDVETNEGTPDIFVTLTPTESIDVETNEGIPAILVTISVTETTDVGVDEVTLVSVIVNTTEDVDVAVSEIVSSVQANLARSDQWDITVGELGGVVPMGGGGGDSVAVFRSRLKGYGYGRGK